METGWLDASGERTMGIPRSFVVNAEGRVAWIGYPADLDAVLSKIVNNDRDIKAALAKRNFNRYLRELDDSLTYDLNEYNGIPKNPDSALLVIDEIVSKEPKLKYAPFIASHTFSWLLKTNSHKAYEYGKAVLVTPTYEDPACFAIIDAIKWYSDKLDLPAEIYRLGAEAYQVQIDQYAYPEIIDIHKLYNKMAAWYWLANDKPEAIAAERKAIELLKSKKNFSASDMDEYQSRLQQYRSLPQAKEQPPGTRSARSTLQNKID
jgi:hypothetical protein